MGHVEIFESQIIWSAESPSKIVPVPVGAQELGRNMATAFLDDRYLYALDWHSAGLPRGELFSLPLVFVALCIDQKAHSVRWCLHDFTRAQFVGPQGLALAAVRFSAGFQFPSWELDL